MGLFSSSNKVTNESKTYLTQSDNRIAATDGSIVADDGSAVHIDYIDPGLIALTEKALLSVQDNAVSAYNFVEKAIAQDKETLSVDTRNVILAGMAALVAIVLLFRGK